MEKGPSKPQPKSEFRWYLTPNLPWWRAALIGGLCTATVLAIYLSSWGEILETRFIRPLTFMVRHRLGKDPKIDPHLKIYALDDSTVEYLQATDLAFSEWAQLVTALAPANPRAVFIDKVFSMPGGKDLEKWAATLKKLPYPIIAGAFTTKTEIRHRSPLDLSRPEFNLKTYVAGGAKKEDTLEDLTFLETTNHFAYGPHPSVRSAFNIGHLWYEGNFFVHSFLRLKENVAIPSAGILAAGNLSFDEGDLYANGFKVRTDARGRMLVNWPHPSTYYNQTYALRFPVDRVRKGEPLTNIPDKSIVVILPGATTGDTDMALTPFGIVPGGYLMTTLISSALTGQWIGFIPFGWLFILLAGVAGTLVGSKARGASLVASVVGGEALTIVGGLILFSYASLEAPWFFCAVSFFSAAAATFGAKTIANEKKVRRLKELLEGTVAPSQLTNILRQPETLSLKPSGHIVTIMFVDIVGFSLIAEKQDAKDAFTNLKNVLSDLTEAVHEFGGVVDKTLGDGLLAFFGYNYDGSAPSAGHAIAALQAGMKIQRLAMGKNIGAIYEGRPVYPLRIGINTAHVFIGDLGNSRRIDLTVVGQGVNLAKRLETACDTDCLMLGKETFERLPQSDGLPLLRRYIQIKHHTELIEAYECDPFVREPHLRAKSQEAYRQYSGVSRGETRVLCPEHPPIEVVSDFASGRVLDYSGGGLSILTDTYLGVGVTLNVTLKSEHSELEATLRKLGVVPLLCEVRWGRPSTLRQGYHLGVSIKGLSSEKKAQLVRELDNIARLSAAA